MNYEREFEVFASAVLMPRSPIPQLGHIPPIFLIQGVAF
jgi:hypothetical protein